MKPHRLVSTISALVLVSIAVSQVRAQTCRDTAYLGFDTRLTAAIASRVPLTAAPVTAFEMSAGRPLVAQGTTLLAARGDQMTGADLKLPLRAILVDHQDRVTLQTDDSVYRLGMAKPEVVARQSGGRLHRSGTQTTMEAKQAATAAQFAIKQEDGRTLPLASIPGVLRLASWNAEGLATIVGNSLFAWRPGEGDLLRLATDEGLERVRDLVLVGPAKVVVALNESLVLLTPQGRLIVGNLKGRVRWSSGTLYVLDERTGTVWSLKGIDTIGAREVDEAYARALIKAVPADAPATHAAFLEAARIVGCELAEKLKSASRGAAAPR